MLKLFGQAQLKHNDDWLEPALGKPFCLLAYLAYMGSWVAREQLSFLFWPDTDEASSRRNLRQLLSRIKKLEYATIELEPSRVRWLIATDVQAFKEATAQQDWAEAVKLYRDDFLLGVSISDSEGFETWLSLEREALRSSWQDSSLRYAEVLTEQQDYALAAQVLGRLVEQDDLAEDIVRAFLQTAYLAGQRDTALSVFERFQRRLKAELDLEPLAETLDLVELIRAAKPLFLGHVKPKESKSSVPLSVLRPPSLVGRAHDLEMLLSFDSSVVAIAGEAGAGKSRLMSEVAGSALLIRSQEGLAQIPFFPLIQLIREQVKQGKKLDLGAYNYDLGAYNYDLVRLVPEAYPELNANSGDISVNQARLLEALCRYLEAMAEPNASFHYRWDDLQWADEASLSFLSYAASSKRLRFLVSYRSHEVTPQLSATLTALNSSHALSSHSLVPLNATAMRQLLAELMNQTQGPPIFAEWLCKTTGGNPMFALEVLKSLFETGLLKANQEGWHSSIDSLTKDYSELDVPNAVSDLIERRMANLSAEALRIIQAAAVISSEFTVSLLKQITGLSDFAILDAIETLELLGLVQHNQFSHDLLRQSIYQQLSLSRKELIHARVAEFSDFEAVVKAEHWLAANRSEEAVAAWQEAFLGYWKQGLLESALPILDRAITHAEDSAKAELLYRKLETLQRLGRNKAALDLAKDLVDHEDSYIAASALNMKAIVLLRQGNVEQAQDCVNRCKDLAKTVENDGFQASFMLTQVILLHALGEFEEVISILETELEVLRGKEVTDDYVSIVTGLAATYDVLGRHDEALPLHYEALVLAKKHGFHYFQVDAAGNLLYCLMDLGRTEEALPLAEEALALGPFENTSTLRTTLASAYLELERYTLAKEQYQNVLQESEHKQLHAMVFARLAECEVKLGNPEVADLLEKAYEMLEKNAAPVFKTRVLINTLNFGSEAQVKRIRALLDDLDLSILPDYLKKELNEALL